MSNKRKPVSVVKGTVQVPYNWAYGRYVRFFYENLKQKRIVGARCTSCQKVLVPPVTVCGRCFADTEADVVEVKDTGEVITYTIIGFSYPGQVLTPPYAVGVIRLDGANTRITHLIKGEDLEKLCCGSKVKAVWREEREGSFFDIEYFEIED